MKKWAFVFVLIITSSLLLCSCGETGRNEDASLFSSGTENLSGSSLKTESNEHSELYLEDYSVDQICNYFKEVVLDMEYSDGEGEVSLVQKWEAPIYYRIYGTPTDEDLKVLNNLFAQLNKINGFVGIYEANDQEAENLSLDFLDEGAFFDSFSEVIGGEDAYGATQFWYYNDTNEIYTARIGYRTDITQATRNSILIEEIINTLGISDTVTREDSIVYQYSNDNTALSEVDWVILKLLYNPAIKRGADFENCKVVIKELYY